MHLLTIANNKTKQNFKLTQKNIFYFMKAYK